MKNLTKPQIELLHTLDKRGRVTMPGTSISTARVLSGLNLVTYKTKVENRGSFYYPLNFGKVVEILLTKEGKDFIYNGGLDTPHPKA